MTYIAAEMRRLIFERASEQCEYCLLPRIAAYPPHEVDHIYAEKHGGQTSEVNLCLSRYDCNHYKGTDIASLDPLIGEPVFLFHPRKNNWKDHFRLREDGVIEPLTSQARATVRLLRFNQDGHPQERARLLRLGRLS